MKNQALFSSKDRSKKLKCRLLQFLFAAETLLIILRSCWSDSLNKEINDIMVFFFKYFNSFLCFAFKLSA